MDAIAWPEAGLQLRDPLQALLGAEVAGELVYLTLDSGARRLNVAGLFAAAGAK